MPFRTPSSFITGVAFLAAVGAVLLGRGVFAQSAPPPTAQSIRAHIAKGIPPRANPGEYLTHVQVGNISIGAEFDRHSVPTPESILTAEDFICVEVGLFGPPNEHLTVSASDFSLRLNGKKATLPVEQFTAVFKNLRDPSYSPPELEEAKSSKAGSINTGGGGNTQSDLGSTPPPVHIPPAMERAMGEHVQSAALPEGDRVLPVAGLIFFRYGGQDKGVRSVELIYSGPAGKTTVKLQP